MCEAGAGLYDNYSGAAFMSEGEGRFLPSENANPAIGEIDRTQHVSEIRIETTVYPKLLPAVLEQMQREHPYEQPAYDITPTLAMHRERTLGRIGRLETSLSANELAQLAKEKLNAKCGVRFLAGQSKNKISTVAVCGGSGAGYLTDAKRLKADALITGEVKHSVWLEAKEKDITLIEAGHFATEAIVLAPLAQILRERFPSIEVIISDTSDEVECI